MRFWLVDAQAFHEPAVLLWCQYPGFAFFPGPLEAAGLQPLVQQHKSVALPVQCLDPVPASAAEEKEGICKWIQPKLLLNQGGQSVDATAKVGVAAGDIHLFGTGEVGQHDFSTRSTISTVTASAPVWISASVPEIRTVTATSLERTGCNTGGVCHFAVHRLWKICQKRSSHSCRPGRRKLFVV